MSLIDLPSELISSIFAHFYELSDMFAMVRVCKLQYICSKITFNQTIREYEDELFWKPMVQKRFSEKDDFQRLQLGMKRVTYKFIFSTLWMHSKLLGKKVFESVGERRLAVFGQDMSGKSACVERYLYNRFVEEYSPEINDPCFRHFCVDNVSILLDIIESNYIEDYSAMWERTCLVRDGFFFVCGMESVSLLKGMEECIQRTISARESLNFPLVVFINKMDLQDEQEVTVEKVRQVLKRVGVTNYFISSGSAKTGENVSVAFEELIRRSWYGDVNIVDIIESVLNHTYVPPKIPKIKKKRTCMIM